MSRNRHEVFKEKVLKRLYPFPSENNNKPKTSGTVTAVSKLDQKTNEEFKPCKSSSSIGSDVQASSVQRKQYTVSLPPDDYTIGVEKYSEPNEPEAINSEDDTAEEGTPEKIQRRRKRKKRKIGNSSQEKGDAGGGDTVAKQDKEKQNLTVKVSKNKKRKLKKKRHKEKLRSAGMIPKSMAVEFTYQPGESSSEDEDLDATERKAAEVLDFLQATQEIYFADRTSPVSEPMVPPATVGGILNNLYTRTVPSSDVAVLYELKSLVLLQDIEMLKSALEEFQDNSMMPPEEATAICSLFSYWITHILPMRKQELK